MLTSTLPRGISALGAPPPPCASTPSAEPTAEAPTTEPAAGRMEILRPVGAAKAGTPFTIERGAVRPAGAREVVRVGAAPGEPAPASPWLARLASTPFQEPFA